MKFSFELKTTATPEHLWNYYADVNQWFAWEDDLENISLAGAFVTGTTGEMTLAGQPPMTFLLTSVIPNQEFSDKTSIPGLGDLFFYHELFQTEAKTIIKHSVEFIPFNREVAAKDLAFIAQVFADVPASVFKLAELANG